MKKTKLYNTELLYNKLTKNKAKNRQILKSVILHTATTLHYTDTRSKCCRFLSLCIYYLQTGNSDFKVAYSMNMINSAGDFLINLENKIIYNRFIS